MCSLKVLKHLGFSRFFKVFEGLVVKIHLKSIEQPWFFIVFGYLELLGLLRSLGVSWSGNLKSIEKHVFFEVFWSSRASGTSNGGPRGFLPY